MMCIFERKKQAGVGVRQAGVFIPLFVVLLLCFVGGAYASKTDLPNVAAKTVHQDPMLVLTQGMAEIVDLEGNVADIMVANPSIVDVMALQSNRLYLVGANLGSTNVIAVNAAGDVISRLTVHVKMDDKVLERLIHELYPDEAVSVRSLTSQLIITGHVSSPSVAEEIMTLASHYAGDVAGEDVDHIDEFVVNMMTVGGESQVMLKVKIIEASREILKELGLETALSNAPGGSLATASFATTSQTGLTEDPMGVLNVLKDTGVGGLGTLQMTINALETTNLVNTLAEPNLTALSGEQAGFLAGGEFPVPVGRDRDGNIVIEYHPFGVSLNFRPTVLDKNLISLQLDTEVSSLSRQNSLTLEGINIPGFNVRRASTTVEMASGGSLMIAGLLKSDVTKGLAGLPGINDVPVLGDLVSSDSFQREETELLVMITPYIVEPYADKKAVQEVPGLKNNPLAAAFSDNVSKLFKAGRLPDSLFSEDKRYGYLID